MPVFIGGSSDQGLAVDVDNVGPDTQGTVTIDAGDFRTAYPLELPHGAHKHFVAYPMVSRENRWAPISCDLETDRGNVHLDVPDMVTDQSTPAALEIGDEPGGLQFLVGTVARAPMRPPGQTPPVYVKPEDAPGRLLAYRSLSAVVLSRGAERLPDSAIEALKQYVLSGGRLLFVGGGGAPVFRDGRWAEILPMAGVHTETRAVILKAGGVTFDGRLNVEVGNPLPGAVVAAGGIVSRPVGLGVVIAIPFDIFGGPMRTWEGRTTLIRNLIASPTGAVIVWPQYTGLTPAYTSVSFSTPGVATGSPTADDPFTFQPPPPTSIFIIVGCYLIIVAPLNFLILRKLRRSELAWYTTPLISFIFAGVLLKLAAGLYAGKLRTSTSGTLAVAEGQPVGVFRGSSQIFFPTAGNVDLKLHGVDWLSSGESAYYQPTEAAGPITAVDVDHLVVPSLPVRNLQFRDLWYEQVVDTSDWFTFVVHSHKGKLTVTVENASPYSVRNAAIFGEGARATVPDIAPGGHATLSLTPSKDKFAPNQLWQAYSASIHRPILRGRLDGFRPGPQIGSEVAYGGGGSGGRRDNGGYVPDSTYAGNDFGIQLVAVGAESTGVGP